LDVWRGGFLGRILEDTDGDEPRDAEVEFVDFIADIVNNLVLLVVVQFQIFADIPHNPVALLRNSFEQITENIKGFQASGNYAVV
jgi:hypothetical protein